jgi:hypothetical protein
MTRFANLGREVAPQALTSVFLHLFHADAEQLHSVLAGKKYKRCCGGATVN